jgi:L-lactate dehydrogenase (cytochrome)
MSAITVEELSKHTDPKDIWIVVNGKVYDVTNFLEDHPGTSKPFLHFAGKDATVGFNKHHPDLDISKADKVILKGTLSN